jgi:cytoskeletal protein CcmA (bactofilin family)
MQRPRQAPVNATSLPVDARERTGERARAAPVAPPVRRRLEVWIAFAVVAVLAFGFAWACAPTGVMGRAEEEVVIGADEVVHETLVVAAGTVRISGAVDGDVVVTARTLTIDGPVHGNVTAIAEDVTVERGAVIDGAVHCLCEALVVRGRVEGNAYVFGDSIAVEDGRIGRDALLIGSQVRVAGDVGRDLWIFGEAIEVSGRVGRDMQGSVGRLDVVDRAVVGGDLDMAVPARDAVQIDRGVTVGGLVRVEERPDAGRSKYVQAGYYLVQLAQLVGAFIVGVIAFSSFPRLRTVPLQGSRAVLVAMGIGILLLVLTPIVSVLAMFTVVGLPIGLIAVAMYVVALYVASIVVAGRLGQAILGPQRRSVPLALFVGLMILTVATELPAIGGLVRLVVIVLGLGILYRAARETSKRG